MITAISPANSQTKSRQNFGALKKCLGFESQLLLANLSNHQVNKINYTLHKIQALQADNSLYDLLITGFEGKKLEFKLSGKEGAPSCRDNMLTKKYTRFMKFMPGTGLFNLNLLSEAAFRDDYNSKNLAAHTKLKTIKNYLPIS